MSARVFPEALPDISTIATALADRSRAAMCAALMDGRAWTVGELAAYAGLARSTASEHVGVLVGRGIAVDTRQGRHRYITLAGDDVARVIEELGALARNPLPTPPSLSAWTADRHLRQGRTCYKHLAGRLGVELSARLEDHDLIGTGWQLTRSGEDLLAAWGVLRAGEAERLAVPCMDSTERRFHLGGPLGTALTQSFFDRAWITRIGRSRAVKVTEAGREALAQAGLAEVLKHLDETTSNGAAG